MKRFLIPLLFVGALALAPSWAQAGGRSSFGFSLGFGGGGYNNFGFASINYNRGFFGHSYYGHGYYGGRGYYSARFYAPIYRSRYYYYDPVYIAPPPVVYVEPAPCYVYPRYYSRSYCAPRYYYSARTYYYYR